jgi:hypothetical protein
MHAHETGLCLDQPAIYRIQVQGRVGQDWADWFDGMDVEIEEMGDRPPITTLTGAVVDQAALQGLLGKLYSLGLPLISVQHLDRKGG